MKMLKPNNQQNYVHVVHSSVDGKKLPEFLRLFWQYIRRELLTSCQQIERRSTRNCQKNVNKVSQLEKVGMSKQSQVVSDFLQKSITVFNLLIDLQYRY